MNEVDASPTKGTIITTIHTPVECYDSDVSFFALELTESLGDDLQVLMDEAKRLEPNDSRLSLSNITYIAPIGWWSAYSNGLTRLMEENGEYSDVTFAPSIGISDIDNFDRQRVRMPYLHVAPNRFWFEARRRHNNGANESRAIYRDDLTEFLQS